MLPPLLIHELVSLSESNRILKIPRQFWYSDVHSEGISIYTKLKIDKANLSLKLASIYFSLKLSPSLKPFIASVLKEEQFTKSENL